MTAETQASFDDPERAAELAIKRAHIEAAEDLMTAFCTRKMPVYEALVLANAYRALKVALATEQTMHAAWRKRAEEAEAMLDPPVCRRQFPDGSVPSNAREAAEGWKRFADAALVEIEENQACWKRQCEELEEERECLNKLRAALRRAARESSSEQRFGELVSEYALSLLPERA